MHVRITLTERGMSYASPESLAHHVQTVPCSSDEEMLGRQTCSVEHSEIWKNILVTD
mgnify:CR=1 FL=1